MTVMTVMATSTKARNCTDSEDSKDTDASNDDGNCDSDKGEKETSLAIFEQVQSSRKKPRTSATTRFSVAMKDVKKVTEKQQRYQAKQFQLQRDHLKYQREHDAKVDEDRKRVSDLFCEYLKQKIDQEKT